MSEPSPLRGIIGRDAFKGFHVPASARTTLQQLRIHLEQRFHERFDVKVQLQTGAVTDVTSPDGPIDKTAREAFVDFLLQESGSFLRSRVK